MDKKKYIILLSTLAIFIIAIITILLANNKGKVNWIKEVEKSNDYQITVNNCNEKETIVPNEVLNEISKKLNNISDNGPWTGDNNKCYSSLIISFSKENQIEYITIKLFKPINNFKEYVGKLKSFDDQTITIEVENEELNIERKNISLIKKYYDWNV